MWYWIVALISSMLGGFVVFIIMACIIVGAKSDEMFDYLIRRDFIETQNDRDLG